MKEWRRGSGSRWWGWIVAAAGAAVVLAGVGAWWLVDPLSVDEPKDRASAIQAAFTIAFGFGGLATLGLFTRRQWHQEQVHEHQRQVAEDAQRNMERTYEHQQRVADDARYDAEQRRITEQYMQAVEQLGHEKAPVRLGGLYALDRLGRNHPEQRQVIAEVWCAYLRRKYTPPADILGGDREGDEGEEEAERTEEQLQKDAEAADEYEVRMTAQRLLIGHLKDPRIETERDDARPDESEEFWHLEQVDLTGATLIDADFDHCWLPRLKADRARFCRLTSFSRTYFGGDAWFGGVRFERSAWFVGAGFGGSARFGGAWFGGDAWFGRARFERGVGFGGVRFGGDAWFGGVRFEREVGFGGVRFGGNARFGGARFGGGVAFGGARFERVALFDEAQFEGNAWFKKAQFEEDPRFVEAQFRGVVRFNEARFGSAGEFTEGTSVSNDRLVMTDVIVDRIELEDEEHVWPPGWEPVPDGDRWKLVRVEE